MIRLTFLLPSTWLLLPTTVIKNCAMLISKAVCIAWDKILFSKLLDVSEVFWSFTHIFKLKVLCTQSRLIKSKGKNVKQRCYRVSRKQQFWSRGQITSKVSSEKNTLRLKTPIIRHSTSIILMDIHKEAIKKK